MDASFFIGRRLRFKGNIAMISIAVSFLVMIIAVSVSFGFRQEIRSSLSTVSGDIRIMPPTANVMDENYPIESDAGYLPYLDKINGIEYIIPTSYRAGIVKNDDDIHGILIKGIPSEYTKLYNIELPDSLALPVSIPSRLAEISGLELGDRMLTYFVGDNVKARQFNVASIHESFVQTDDKLIVYANISDIQRLNSWEANQVSAIEIHTRSKDMLDIHDICTETGNILNAYLEDDDEYVIASSTSSEYPQIFQWLDLIDFNVIFILILMTVVAGFNMISGLLIMLFENISTIGLLKSMGMTDKSISKVFFSSSAVLVLKGMFLGNLSAILFCIIQQTTHLLKLNPENYFVSFVPVDLNWRLILSADLISFVVIMVLLLIPCSFISKVDPAETVRMK